MRLRITSAAIGAIMAASARAATPDNLISRADFDYYELTMSWSPGFCETEAGKRSPEQCGEAAAPGVGFVVHGLWPDNFDRPYPEFCGGQEAWPRELDQAAGVFATRDLAAHEFVRHGSCTKLGADNYFQAVKYIRDQFTIPETLRAPHAALSLSPADIENAFIAVNAHLTPENMAVTCVRGELLDMRFCVSKSLSAFVNCPKVAGHSCHAGSITVAPTR